MIYVIAVLVCVAIGFGLGRIKNGTKAAAEVKTVLGDIKAKL